jgi:conjugative relaxase-like TrwC/TraI family protein
MLAIKAQKSSPNEEVYFREDLSRDDYYDEQQHTPGRWYGRGCEALGLDRQAPVRQADFVALCRGLRPGDGTRLTQRMAAHRRCVYDLTISAPKSLSVMALVAGDERLIAAHDKAVTATLEAAEQLAAVRVRKGAAADTRQSRVTGNIVCAIFPHRESRALDPQLHHHCVVFNVTFDPVEKRMKALEARPFYDHAQDLTQLYRAHLAESLHALGYDTYLDRHRCVQIRGVDAAVMSRFSKRAAQRDALVALRAQELGRPLTKGEVSRVVHQNRAKKQRHIAPQALRKIQLAQLSAEERRQLERVKALALAGPRPPLTRPLAPRRQPGIVAAPELDWIAGVLLALLAVRAVGINPYTFSPTFSFPQRIYYASRFIRQAQRYGQQRGRPSLTR